MGAYSVASARIIKLELCNSIQNVAAQISAMEALLAVELQVALCIQEVELAILMVEMLQSETNTPLC